ncbi:MAG: hypothetical protein QF754_04050 [Alphaproteobacteria bacterium]|nr:hypothetical protein [Alphaproteobacteria bacterium]
MAAKEQKPRSCPTCRPLQANIRLERAQQYDRAAGRVDAALAAGTLVADPIEPWDTRFTPCSYARMRADEAAGRGLPDIFSYYFRCTACGRRFNLMCEIYHGRGGHWIDVPD